MNIYDFEANTIQGKKVSLGDYKGKVILIINTASKCGFTPQFAQLEEINKKYKDKGVVLLGFPCNQFAQQDPGSSKEISEFCQLNYGVTFQMFEKVDVRGENAHPLFKFLTSQKGFKGLDMDHPIASKLMEVMENNYPEYLNDDSIKWNFTKFLINKDGEVVNRYEPTFEPSKICDDIEKLL